MEKLRFDSGMREFSVNGGKRLRFNPTDPNVVARFLQLGQKLSALAHELAQEKEGDGVALLCAADAKIKALLSWTFGQQNDFEEIFAGLNLLAVAENGERVITNFLEALRPILTEGAEQCMRAQTEQAVQKAVRRRSAQ